MLGALIIFAATAAVGVVLWLLDQRGAASGERRAESQEEGAESGERRAESQEAPGQCCGLHAVCRKWARPRPELYYDDEELDAFAGRGADDYAPDELEQWRDVLYTLPEGERADWGAAVGARGLQMPAPIREEWRQLVAEADAQT